MRIAQRCSSSAASNVQSHCEMPIAIGRTGGSTGNVGFQATGPLGSAYAPFMPGANANLQQNLRLNIAQSRLDDRRSLLTNLDRLRREVDARGVMQGIDGFNQQAVDLMLGGAAQAFDLDRSFQMLFMIIIGGMGSILGSFLGAFFMVLLPIFLNITIHGLFRGRGTDLASNLDLMIFGGLIIFFLIVEPHGLARLWQITKEKLRLWPFPH